MDIRKYKLDSDFEKLSLEVDYNVTLDSLAITDNKNGNISPRIQSDVVIHGGLIDDINKQIIDIIKKDIYKTNELIYTFKNWVYIVDKDSPEGIDYHNHLRMNNLNTIGEWTYVYYVSMPNNLKQDDGYIYFKDDNETISMLPEVGDLLIFPSDLKHLPKVNPTSTINRRVIGGIISSVSYKTKKTLL